MNTSPLLRGHVGMVTGCFDTLLAQFTTHLLCVFARQTVDDACNKDALCYTHQIKQFKDYEQDSYC